MALGLCALRKVSNIRVAKVRQVGPDARLQKIAKHSV